MILVLALSSLRCLFCLDLGLFRIVVDCVKRQTDRCEARGDRRVCGGLRLQYYDVIARDTPLIWCDYEKNWWITSELVDQQSQHVHWNRVKIRRFSSNCEVDHNLGAILTIGPKLLRSRRSPPDRGSLA